ncbi:HEAT repeat domain-containing protein [Kitasatospora sp. RG8]|uniref:HEAT repeat domain-containing protein n=1 Tax=Kitasatospora sp. RG8 TaxID=2820815 RepID=UPI001AE015C0|nr:HEAT repeat domain-containing protein [Kitasatospora sp. RG8]MBP0450494.1 HEAT repeat domain-containing protein [Kitasatospora sp. RG8]
MFDTLHEIDWAALGHAYGRADDVPAMLIGLASPDPGEREEALDDLYGAVHHQGDVCDATLACLPFLFELIADQALPDRGPVVELLTSIGEAGRHLVDEQEAESTDESTWRALLIRGREAMTARADAFTPLLADPDPAVRCAAPGALARLHADGPATLALLRERLPHEPDTEARTALATAAAALAGRFPDLAGPVITWLTALADDPDQPAALRLGAFARRARLTPGAPPADTLPTAVGLLRRIPADQDGHATDVALRILHRTLGDRPADRAALCTEQLTAAGPAPRRGGCRETGRLLGEVRGSFSELVALLGRRLADPDPTLGEAVLAVLPDLFRLAAPAADAVADRLATVADPWDDTHPDSGPDGRRLVQTLTRLGDPRALPALAAALDRPVLPHDLGFLVADLGPAAAPLAVPLRERLAGLPLDGTPRFDQADPLLTALGVVGDADAVPAVLRLLRAAPAGPLTDSALRSLARLGPAAAEAAPELRTLLAAPCSPHALPAAAALWSATGDTGAVLPLLLAKAADPSPWVRRDAAKALAAIGPAAADAAPALRAMLADPEVWVRVDGATALWHTAADAEAVLPVLTAAWTENAHTRATAAACFTAMGPAAADAFPLVRTELTTTRRHNAGFGSSHAIHDDELLLTTCRSAAEAIPTAG